MDTVFTLLSALKGQQRQMDATSNNIANANTPGFKRDKVVFREMFNEYSVQDRESEEESYAHEDFMSPLSRGSISFVAPDHVSPAMTTGRIIPTSSPMDVALQGEGFFVVNGAQGERYTRNGQFLEDQEGYLATPSGDRIMGEKGPILIKNREFSVGQEGTVMINRQVTDKLRIVKFEQPSRLTKLGNGFWAPGSDRQMPLPQTDIRLQQGVYESSNVEVVKEMVDMIAVNRSYEAAQRALRANDEINERSISLARV